MSKRYGTRVVPRPGIRPAIPGATSRRRRQLPRPGPCAETGSAPAPHPEPIKRTPYQLSTGSGSIGKASRSAPSARIARILVSITVAGLNDGGKERGGNSSKVATNSKTSLIAPYMGGDVVDDASPSRCWR